jgi:PQQ-like domain
MRGRVRAIAVLLAVVVGGGPAVAATSATAACAPEPFTTLVLTSAATGAIVRSYPDVSGVSAIAADGRGGWFVSGAFTCDGRYRRPGLMRLDHAGSIDPSWHAELPKGHPPVSLLVRSGPTLYAAGGFGVEALDAATGARRWVARVAGGLAPGVGALAATSGAVYVGGGFKAIDQVLHPSLAALDPRTGKLLAWNQPVLGSPDPIPIVDALWLVGPRLYLGGNTITTVDGQRRPGFAAVDTATGRVSDWVPGTAPGLVAGAGVGDVETILVAHGVVFSAGHDGFGIVSARTGAISPWLKRVHGEAVRFAAAGSTVYLGGNVRNSFSAVGAHARHNLAAIDLATGRVTPWAPDVNVYVVVAALAPSGNEVLVGGSFSKTLG